MNPAAKELAVGNLEHLCLSSEGCDQRHQVRQRLVAQRRIEHCFADLAVHVDDFEPECGLGREIVREQAQRHISRRGEPIIGLVEMLR